jgi:hypothetical protein
MSTKTIRICDGCGSERLESNHWIVFAGSVLNPKLYSYDDAAQSLTRDDMRLDYCGQSCAMSAFSQWMDTGSIEKAQAPAVEPQTPILVSSIDDDSIPF